jgi:hypothetical protein
MRRYENGRISIPHVTIRIRLIKYIDCFLNKFAYF